MVIDPPQGLRDELLAAIAVLEPQINGLLALMNEPLSVEAKNDVEIALGERSQRRDLMRSLILAMDQVVALWTKLKSTPLSDIHIAAAIIQELQDNLNNHVIAAGLFGATASTEQDQATIARIDAGMKDAQAARAALIQP